MIDIAIDTVIGLVSGFCVGYLFGLIRCATLIKQQHKDDIDEEEES